ncbi:MAG: UDP-2,3-diacylglucosamine diphosphatase LpxI, partial [Elusimicrobiota bacterium]
FKGDNNKNVRNVVENFEVVPLGHLGSVINYFKNNNVTRAIMAGLVSHRNIFSKRVSLDSVTADILNSIKDRRADSILGGIAQKLNSSGIEVLELLEFLEKHLAEKGILTQRQPTPAENEDIQFGFKIAKEISRNDTGQVLIIKNKCVVAIESIEGTDACIKRGAKLAGPGTTVIKVAKLHQDMRFDIPVIGTRTLKIMKRVKSNSIAVEAQKTCLVDKPEVISTANRYGISIIGI